MYDARTPTTAATMSLRAALRRLFAAPAAAPARERFPYAVPEKIAALASVGIWPLTHADTQRQNVESLFEVDSVRDFAPDERALVLYAATNFRSVAAELRSRRARGDTWATDFNYAVADIDPELTLIIGDFGLGSDACLALDYRYDPSEPAVIKQQWPQCPPSAAAPIRWIRVAPTFEAFWAQLRLRDQRPR